MQEQNTATVQEPVVKQDSIEAWQSRLGASYWQLLYRFALEIEELDGLLSDRERCPDINYTSQKDWLPLALVLASVLDRDDAMFLPREMSLACLYRGVSVEDYVGQYMGNVLDPAKGRLGASKVMSEPFQIFPEIGRDKEMLEHALGVALAMRVRQHAKLVVLPIHAKLLESSEGYNFMRTLGALEKVPLMLLVYGGDTTEAANSCGLSNVTVDSDFLSMLKTVKIRVDRARFRKTASMVIVPEKFEGNVSDILSDFMKRSRFKNGDEAELRSLIREQVEYGVERARALPSAPITSVVKDLRYVINPELESQWKNWSKAHGR